MTSTLANNRKGGLIVSHFWGYVCNRLFWEQIFIYFSKFMIQYEALSPIQAWKFVDWHTTLADILIVVHK